MTGGDAESVAELARQALADDTMVEADNGFLTVPAIRLLALADLDEAPAHWDRLLTDSVQSGSLFAVSCVHLWNGVTQTLRGELAEAEGLLRAGRQELALWGAVLVDGAYFTSTISRVRLERGDVAGAREALGPRPARNYDAYEATHMWLRSDVEIMLAEGRAEEALERSTEFGELVGRQVNPAWVPWRSLQALALDRLGRTDEAVARAEEELVHARAWGAPGTVGRTLRILGSLARRRPGASGGVGGAAGGLARAAGARQVARRPWRGDAPGPSPQRRPRAAAPGAGAGRRLRRRRPGR